jgi:hypothetical protein
MRHRYVGSAERFDPSAVVQARARSTIVMIARRFVTASKEEPGACSTHNRRPSMDASPTLYQLSDPGISGGKRALKKHAIPKT